jgi:cytoplasmic iron level regulating protein YaaA (DUF328/UPF0246 family)
VKILLAPSETKSSGGEYLSFNQESFLFPKLYEHRQEILQTYQEHVNKGSIKDLSKLFGLKKEQQIKSFKNNIFTLPTKKAIERYTGVAFDYLDYASLQKEEQTYLDKNLLLFSNLFGPLKADDRIPEYKLKQGVKLASLNIEKHYKTHFSKSLDTFLGDTIIDLRAGFYEKFYTISVPYITFKFIKEGKVVSHWAKAYRGKVLRALAVAKPNTYDEVKEVILEDLTLIEIQKSKLKETWILEISDTQP